MREERHQGTKNERKRTEGRKEKDAMRKEEKKS